MGSSWFGIGVLRFLATLLGRDTQASNFRVADVKNPASLSAGGVRRPDIRRRQMVWLLDGVLKVRKLWAVPECCANTEYRPKSIMPQTETYLAPSSNSAISDKSLDSSS